MTATARSGGFSACVLALALLCVGDRARAATLRIAIDDHRVATLSPELGLMIEAMPRANEGMLSFAKRYCGDSQRGDEIEAANPGVTRLLRGVRYRIPYDCLAVQQRRELMEALFPRDRPSVAGWSHQVGDGGGRSETLWSIAEWFTGSGDNHSRIREVNGLADETIVRGQTLVIPTALLRQPFRSSVEHLVQAQEAHSLIYGRDRRGEYASYRLEPGEALYSSVVVRFTGRLFAADVNPLAEEIARRSEIDDVTDIPVGYEVKIPFDYLSPEFLPPSHPRRQEYEADLLASRQFMNEVRAVGLEGVTVVLDAGHGGRDSGARNGRVWESTYVYDIMLRIKSLLEETTGARVVATTRDGERHFNPDRDRLSPSSGHAVLTTPPYPIETAQIGTHLRWYLANDVLAKELKRGVDAERVVFLSIHADSLHPSVRGAMVYVPGLLPIPQSYGKEGAVFRARREVRARPRVSFGRSERVQSEGLSRDLANHLIRGFERGGLAIHPNKPVRDRIVRRGGRPWVPAVLRYNAVPGKVLLEVCNLANQEDLELIQTRRFRQRVAQAVVDGLLAYYGYAREPGAQVAAAGS